MRGPVVYCFEGADNGECIQALRIPREIKAETELCKEGVLAGNVLIHLRDTGWRAVMRFTPRNAQSGQT